MLRRLLPLVLLAVASSSLTAAAQARDDVLVLSGDRLTWEVDRYLPALSPDERAQAALPPAPQAESARGGRSVPEAVRSAQRAGNITPREARRYLRIWDMARRSRARAEGRCQQQLQAVIDVVQGMARRGELRSTRMAAVFLTLESNARFWVRNPEIAAGGRVRISGSPVILQHYAGLGLQLQMLGNFGRANALIHACRGDYGPEATCERRRLRWLLDAMWKLSSRRAGGPAWEYYFPFLGGKPPWGSGMAQATGIQAFAGGARELKSPRYKRLANDALALLSRRPPLGVALDERGGRHFLLYSFAPSMRVLNAHLQTTVGLLDHARLSHDKRAKRLYSVGDHWSRASLGRFDTGSWSRYSEGGAEATYSYQDLVTDFLRKLCQKTKDSFYCDSADRFKRYLAARKKPGGGDGPSARGPRCGQ